MKRLAELGYGGSGVSFEYRHADGAIERFPPLARELGKLKCDRAADIAASILKRAKPADIPVQQADEFELVVNLRTAKALGIKIPQSVMARATRIVE